MCSISPSQIQPGPGCTTTSPQILKSLASPQAMDYDPQPKGLPSARAAVADYYRDRAWNQPGPERVLLTTSTSEGYSFVFRLLCNPGDELLVPKPSYPLFEFLADLQDVKLVPYPLIYDHGWQMDFPSLQNAVTKRTRGVVVVHPNNPTGSYVHPEEQKSLNRFCRGTRTRANRRRSISRLRPRRRKAAKLRCESRSAHLHAKRSFQDLGAAANEGSLDRNQWPGGRRRSSAGASGGNRRHLSLDECAHPVGDSSAARSAQNHSAAITRSRARQLGRTRPPARSSEELSAFKGGRRMVRSSCASR